MAEALAGSREPDEVLRKTLAGLFPWTWGPNADWVIGSVNQTIDAVDGGAELNGQVFYNFVMFVRHFMHDVAMTLIFVDPEFPQTPDMKWLFGWEPE